jgi:hypothetical protein
MAGTNAIGKGHSPGETIGQAVSGMAGAVGSGSIILEPRQMFQTLQDMEQATQDILKLIQEVAQILETVSVLTFAVGFGELIKAAEAVINQVGTAVVAANNAFNSACRDVINQLVQKFSPEGAKSDYNSPPFVEISIRINQADRTQVLPAVMRSHLDENQQKNRQLASKTSDMREIYRNTANFWSGTAAEKIRNRFESKIVPQFEELESILNKIVERGYSWVEEAVRFEASLGGGSSYSGGIDPSDLDNLSEMGEMESMRLQMAMDRRSKFTEALSNIEKKMSQTSSDITKNIK